jgi:hypothetical protein
MITYTNAGNTKQNNVVIRDSLPLTMSLVPGSTKVTNSTYPNGQLVSNDNITHGGITIGNYSPGAVAYITFRVKVPAADKLECGNTVFNNVGVARPEGMQEYFDIATTTVNKECQPEQPQPQYSCTAFEVTKGENRTVTVSKFTTSQKNATFKNVVIDWGENGVQPLSTNKAVGQAHQYAADGTYTITATAHFSTAKDNDVTSTNGCVATVTFSTTPTPPETPEKPEVLPSTGAGSVIGLFAVTAAVASAAYYFVVGRRYAQ